MSENFEHLMNNNDKAEKENQSQELPPLPDDFRQNVTGTWGKKGEEWLQQLPTIINRYGQEWSLDIGTPEHKLNYNYVAPARLQDGTEVILKACFPNPEAFSEMDALNAYAGNKAVRLLKADREAGVLLLERIRPGQALTELQERDDEEATKIAATVIRDLPVAIPTEGTFPTVTQWGEAFQRVRNKELPAEVVAMLDKAEELLAELDQSKQEEKLLHGDLHYENILLDENRGWVAIDPKGVIGDPAYEAARLLHNPIPGLLQEDNPQQIIERRVEILSSALSQDRERILKWAYVDCILSGAWSMEEDADYAHAIESAKIFQAIMEKK